MAYHKSNIANIGIRIFLQEVGKFYDEQRKLEPFGPKKKQKEQLLDFFKNQCCYCGVRITEKTLSKDHLVPMNKEHLGLHAWGNVVPCCQQCNNEKQQTDWIQFLKSKAKGKDYTSRKQNIKRFVKKYKYNLSLNLQDVAGHLYEDVGEVAMTLINLRYNQARERIEEIVSKEV